MAGESGAGSFIENVHAGELIVRKKLVPKTGLDPCLPAKSTSKDESGTGSFIENVHAGELIVRKK
ncbi:MAG TPA: hypothetical protein PK014_06170, partial [Thermoanaerobaculia bacterium]|nr:hypothetical protein [Thermoanaerobaculia bacterium]